MCVVAASSLRLERFVAKPAGLPVLAGPFMVQLARSGGSIEVDPAHSILEAVRGVGVAVLSSCRARHLRDL